ncbi:MAG TPA: DUF4190 domain-containing protein [Pirellulaceae bacterium]|nr:DUF4190 domain-containing protein [Pirellulaceae bacterium]HMO91068.1 DUF4190 domain-containing protein [Pirellulaceae bacterium]HMP68182.1 DUF4190 domain-containing protein [Pirellulaceae bacterium]
MSTAASAPEKSYFSVSHDSDVRVPYRSLSASAICSFVFGLLSLLSFVFATALFLPLLAIALGFISLKNFWRYPDELTGKVFAKFGLVLGLVSLMGGVSLHSYIYATEVPEGYERINFRMLREDVKTPLPFAEAAEELDGKKVFIKGYTRPGTKRKNLSEFIMVGSFGDCCFGGQEKLTEVVAVRIMTGETVDYSLRLRKIAGVFRLNRKTTVTSDKEVPEVFYQIDADYVR